MASDSGAAALALTQQGGSGLAAELSPPLPFACTASFEPFPAPPAMDPVPLWSSQPLVGARRRRIEGRRPGDGPTKTWRLAKRPTKTWVGVAAMAQLGLLWCCVRVLPWRRSVLLFQSRPGPLLPPSAPALGIPLLLFILQPVPCARAPAPAGSSSGGRRSELPGRAAPCSLCLP